DSAQQQVGEELRAFGFPDGMSNGYAPTVTRGILSAIVHQHLSDRVLLQTDAAINPGNSGGPLLNLQGKVVGVDFASRTDMQGVNWAIASDTVRQFLAQHRNQASPLYRGDAVALAPRDGDMPDLVMIDHSSDDSNNYTAVFASDMSNGLMFK